VLDQTTTFFVLCITTSNTLHVENLIDL